MDEGRKRVLLIAATILAARKLSQYEGPARVSTQTQQTVTLSLLTFSNLYGPRLRPGCSIGLRENSCVGPTFSKR